MSRVLFEHQVNNLTNLIRKIGFNERTTSAMVFALIVLAALPVIKIKFTRMYGTRAAKMFTYGLGGIVILVSILGLLNIS